MDRRCLEGGRVCLESVCRCENGSVQPHTPIKEAPRGVLKVSASRRGEVFKMLRRLKTKNRKYASATSSPKEKRQQLRVRFGLFHEASQSSSRARGSWEAPPEVQPRPPLSSSQHHFCSTCHELTHHPLLISSRCPLN